MTPQELIAAYERAVHDDAERTGAVAVRTYLLWRQGVAVAAAPGRSVVVPPPARAHR